MFFHEYFGFPLSVLFHQCPILILSLNITWMTSGQSSPLSCIKEHWTAKYFHIMLLFEGLISWMGTFHFYTWVWINVLFIMSMDSQIQVYKCWLTCRLCEFRTGCSVYLDWSSYIHWETLGYQIHLSDHQSYGIWSVSFSNNLCSFGKGHHIEDCEIWWCDAM